MHTDLPGELCVLEFNLNILADWPVISFSPSCYHETRESICLLLPSEMLSPSPSALSLCLCVYFNPFTLSPHVQQCVIICTAAAKLPARAIVAIAFASLFLSFSLSLSLSLSLCYIFCSTRIARKEELSKLWDFTVNRITIARETGRKREAKRGECPRYDPFSSRYSCLLLLPLLSFSLLSSSPRSLLRNSINWTPLLLCNWTHLNTLFMVTVIKCTTHSHLLLSSISPLLSSPLHSPPHTSNILAFCTL